MRSTSLWSRIVPLAAVLLFLAGTAGAESDDDTDAAFSALLAMPGVQPKEGGWLIPEQAEPAPESEKDLIARLRRLKKDGANFNTIRHRGTLLAHAIRAGKDRTAIWLLHNGADPKHVLFTDNATAYDLASQYKRTAVVRMLEGRYGFKPPKLSTPGLTVPKAPTPAAATQSREQQAIALMARLMAPHQMPSKAEQLEWQEFAATLSRDEYVALFKDGAHLDELIRLVRDSEGGLEDALSRLPLDVVRRNAQKIADILAEWSYATYYSDPKISYTASSLSWPALWNRIDQPLRYEQRPDLAGRIPPSLWPGLFASGYSKHDADITGCLLSVVDVPAFKALWPDFQRFFADAREEAPALVLGKYRLERERAPCYYSSSPADTVAKLAFLREQGITTPVAGLRNSLLEDAGDPSLLAMTKMFSPQAKRVARLISIPPSCEPAFNEVWLNTLIKKVSEVGWGIPAEYAQAIDVPGHSRCGLIISGDRYQERPEAGDDFFYGPLREGSTRCADLPDDGEVWVEEAGRIRSIKISGDRCEGGCTLRRVLDTQTGKHYLLNEGKRGALCSQSWELPDAYEWQANPQDQALLPSSDGALIDRLLREQCHESPERDLVCHGLAPLGDPSDRSMADRKELVTALRDGRVVTIKQLVDLLGAERMETYGAAIAAHDRAQISHLLAAGIPTWWTAAEIRKLGTTDLPLAEKRRRIALLFADRDQLERTLNEDRYFLPEELLAWLPYSDWEPILRIIGRNPDLWRDAAESLRRKVEKDHPFGPQLCDIDRAQGFLCGGGIRFD